MFAMIQIQPTQVPGVQEPAYLFRPNDVIDISVARQPELKETIKILPDGTISYPYVGTVKAAGLSTSALQALLRQGLAKRYVNPDVTITVSLRRENRVAVVGAVKTPGMFDVTAQTHLLDVIAQAGGLTVTRPEWVEARLVRASGETLQIALVPLLSGQDTRQNVPVEDGDVLLLSPLTENLTHVQVLGEVARPGVIEEPSDGSVASVLAAVGGPLSSAALSRVKIIRNGVVTSIDLGPKAFAESGSHSRLLPGDTLYVPKNDLLYSVLGAVRIPGAAYYPEEEPLTILSALARAGGPDADANLKDAKYLRRVDGKIVIEKINLDNLLRKGIGIDRPFLPGEVLYIPARGRGTGLGLSDLGPLVGVAQLATGR